jgi:Zn ribbon nucleic-acid-binding protein
MKTLVVAKCFKPKVGDIPTYCPMCKGTDLTMFVSEKRINGMRCTNCDAYFTQYHLSDDK